MTDPTPLARPSTSIAYRIVDAVGGGLYRLVGGAILFVPGGLLLYRETQHNYQCDEALRTVPISVAVALMVAGALVVTPSLGAGLTNIFVTVAPYLPWVGGRRASDPPAVPPLPPVAPHEPEKPA